MNSFCWLELTRDTLDKARVVKQCQDYGYEEFKAALIPVGESVGAPQPVGSHGSYGGWNFNIQEGENSVTYNAIYQDIYANWFYSTQAYTRRDDNTWVEGEYTHYRMDAKTAADAHSEVGSPYAA